MLKKLLPFLLLATLLFADTPTKEEIIKIYVATYSRAPDAKGLEYWSNSGLSRQEIAKYFFDSSETTEAYPPGSTTRDFVKAVYQNLFNRDPDAGGWTYWADQIDKGNINRSFLILFAIDTDDAHDASIMNNKTEVSMAFVNLLGDKTNIVPGEQKDSPAYKGSIKVISGITEDRATVDDMLTFLESIRGSEDPIALMLDMTFPVSYDAPPVITLNGQDTIVLKEGDSYIEAGATAYDDRDGAVNVRTTGSVNTSIIGTYTLVYTAVDSAGNNASRSRIVSVVSAVNSAPDTLDLSYDYIAFWKQVASDFDEYTYSDIDYLYASVPDADSCDMGVLSEEVKTRVVLVSNHTRELHGLSPLTYHYDYDEEVQASALIMKANTMMTHHPSSNSQCYTQEGYTGSSTSNIYSGYGVTDPAQHIVGWINDARNASSVSAVGHRRWSLNPFEKYIAYGQNDGYAALKVFGYDSINTNIDIDYVAFPYKRYPYLFISNDPSHPTPWSFTVVEKKGTPFQNSFDYFNNATISVKEKNSGNQLSTTNKYYDKTGYGVANVLTWQVTDWKYDTVYEVTVDSVSMQSGEIKSFVYEVYIDYRDIITISRPNEDGDTIDGYDIMGTLKSNQDEDSFVIYLSGTKTFTGKNSVYSNMAFYINLYDSNKLLIKSSDEPFTMEGLNGIYTIVISHRSKETSRYYTAEETGYSVEIQ